MSPQANNQNDPIIGVGPTSLVIPSKQRIGVRWKPAKMPASYNDVLRKGLEVNRIKNMIMN